MRTAQELIAARIHTSLCLVACRENLEEIGDYLRLTRKIGASGALVIPLERLGNAASLAARYDGIWDRNPRRSNRLDKRSIQG